MEMSWNKSKGYPPTAAITMYLQAPCASDFLKSGSTALLEIYDVVQIADCWEWELQSDQPAITAVKPNLCQVIFWTLWQNLEIRDMVV